MTGARALRTARAAGLAISARGGKVVVSGPTAPPPELLDSLRVYRIEVIEVLNGNRCRRCGERMGWPEPCGVIYGDSSAEHDACRIWSAAERALHSPDALADPAEITIRGELEDEA